MKACASGAAKINGNRGQSVARWLNPPSATIRPYDCPGYGGKSRCADKQRLSLISTAFAGMTFSPVNPSRFMISLDFQRGAD